MPPDVVLAARSAGADDIDTLVYLYRVLEEEQTALKYMWPLADGLAEPVDDTLGKLVASDDVEMVIGEIEGYPFGFVIATVDDMLPQAQGEQLGSIRIIFTEPEARGVGLGETMIKEMLARLRGRGLQRFDAYVLPGHRLAKNFFEASGFAARSIIMHHRDDEE